METKACSKCGWEADAAKAFCPECGEPMVEEQKREQSSEFVEAGQTKQFSPSVFNLILNADEKPAPGEQPLTPVPAPPPAAAPPQAHTNAPPAESRPTQPTQPAAPGGARARLQVRPAGVTSVKPLGASKPVPKTEPKTQAQIPVPAAQPEPQKPVPQKGRSWIKILLLLFALAILLFLAALGVGAYLYWRFYGFNLPM